MPGQEQNLVSDSFTVKYFWAQYSARLVGCPGLIYLSGRLFPNASPSHIRRKYGSERGGAA